MAKLTNHAERFWKSVDKEGPVHPTLGFCWIWLKYCNPYGRFSADSVRYLAHRFSWEHYYGNVPDGLDVLHKCDNPRCVNPKHLFLGTDLDNMRDKVAKGRQPRGENNGRAKLTNEQVILIRKLYVRGVVGYAILAKRFGVCQNAIRQIVSGSKWKHLA